MGVNRLDQSRSHQSRLDELMDKLETTEGLDGVAEPLQAWIHQAVPSGPLRNALSGTRLGHPVHE